MSRRDELGQYRGDVFYDVWRSGGNPDAVNDDRVEDAYYDGLEADYAASIELNHQREVRRRHREAFGDEFPEDAA